MIFDLFHSLADPMMDGKRMGPQKVFQNYLDQVLLAETLGFDTAWIAESHFSSETQKKTSVATIPRFYGEVGFNADSFQLMHLIASKTKRIHMGTAIHNIVGGSGGPIASADRVNLLHHINTQYWNRTLRIGVASGRFPYQNTPFGIGPRTETEATLWSVIRSKVFLEALEIFLRLSRGEELSSNDIKAPTIEEDDLDPFPEKDHFLKRFKFPMKLKPFWNFEKLRLVPETQPSEQLRFVLGSQDPKALTLAQEYADVDLFNLSFTPPKKIESLHQTLRDVCEQKGWQWHRSRLPRTVMVFTDTTSKGAKTLANQVLDAYIEAMRGTARVPDKHTLLDRALVGDPSEIRDQLHPDNPRGFHADDRLMLWFEFNQQDGADIQRRMTLFHEKVIQKLPGAPSVSKVARQVS